MANISKRDRKSILLIILAIFIPLTGGLVYLYNKKALLWIILFTFLPVIGGIITLILWILGIFQQSFN